MEEVKSNLSKRLLRLLKETQVQVHRPGSTSQAAIKGFFALEDKLITTNGRMLLLISFKHGLLTNRQYYFNGLKIYPCAVSGFIPSSFQQVESMMFDRRYALKSDQVGVFSFIQFCFALGVVPDLTETSKVLDVLYLYFRKEKIWYLATQNSTNPIGIHVTGEDFTIGIYCLPALLSPMTLEEIDYGIKQRKTTIGDPTG